MNSGPGPLSVKIVVGGVVHPPSEILTVGEFVLVPVNYFTDGRAGPAGSGQKTVILDQNNLFFLLQFPNRPSAAVRNPLFIFNSNSEPN